MNSVHLNIQDQYLHFFSDKYIYTFLYILVSSVLKMFQLPVSNWGSYYALADCIWPLFKIYIQMNWVSIQKSNLQFNHLLK